MKHRIVLVIGLLIVLLMITPLAAAQGGSPGIQFHGCWGAIDVDGSQEYTFIQMRGPSQVFIRYVDLGASVCGLGEDGQPLYAGYFQREGIIEGNTLITGEAAVICLTDPPYLWGEIPGGSMTYDPATDMLGGAIRVNNGECAKHLPSRRELEY